MGEFQEPWRSDDAALSPRVRDHSGRCVLVATPLAGGAEAEAVRSRVLACVNFLAGVPAARLTASDPAACMFLAWLRGDEAAALVAADKLQDEANARATGEPSRAELIDAIARLVIKADNNARMGRTVWVAFHDDEVNALRKLAGISTLDELRAGA